MISFNAIYNIESIPIKFLNSLNMSVDPKLILSELEMHPDYPSLLSISDVLTNFSVKNEAFRVNPEELNQIPCPFAAQTNINQHDFVVVKKLTDEYVWLSNEKWNNHKMSLKGFKDIFSGVILVAEPNENQTSFLSKTLRGRSAKTPLLALGLLVVLVAGLFESGFFRSLYLAQLVMTGLKTTGIVIGCLLLIQSIDTNNPLVKRFCQGGNQSSCNAILSSGAAKVFSWLSWSEVGFFYFSGTWLLIIFNGNVPGTWGILAFLNLVSLPYTFYSIYYQARIAKQWCVLCCSVQALLWLEFAFLISGAKLNWVSMSVPAPEIALRTIICLATPVLIWFTVKPMILGLKQLQPLKTTLRNFKYNTEIFRKLLTEQTKYVAPDRAWSILLGADEPAYTITMVSNLHCQPCAKTHKKMEEILKIREDVGVRVIFNTQNDETDPRFLVTRHMLALNAAGDKSLVQQALHDWYLMDNKKYDVWAKKYPLPETDFAALSTIMDKQRQWCDMVNLEGTPTLYIDGYYLPDVYQLQDLKYLLDYK